MCTAQVQSAPVSVLHRSVVTECVTCDTVWNNPDDITWQSSSRVTENIEQLCKIMKCPFKHFPEQQDSM